MLKRVQKTKTIIFYFPKPRKDNLIIELSELSKNVQFAPVKEK